MAKNIASMAGFTVVARLHSMTSSSNFIGQLVQNAGAIFHLLGERYEGFSWKQEKQKLDNDLKKAGRKMTWPQTFQALGDMASESIFSKRMIAYLVGMSMTKLAWRDMITAELLKASFAGDDGEFSPERWDNWTQENKYSVVIRKKDHSEVEFVPSGDEVRSFVVTATLVARKGYASMDNVSARSADIDYNSLFDAAE